jgi:hypothetical protein
MGIEINANNILQYMSAEEIIKHKVGFINFLKTNKLNQYFAYIKIIYNNLYLCNSSCTAKNINVFSQIINEIYLEKPQYIRELCNWDSSNVIIINSSNVRICVLDCDLNMLQIANNTFINCGNDESNINKLIDMIKNGFDIEFLDSYIYKLDNIHIGKIITQSIIENPNKIRYFKTKIMELCDKKILNYYDLVKKIIDSQPNNIIYIENDNSLINNEELLQLCIIGIKKIYNKNNNNKIINNIFYYTKLMIGKDKVDEITKCFKIKFFDSDKIKNECPICYDENKCSVMTMCNHQFCYLCLSSWLNYNDENNIDIHDKCPMCNQIININTVCEIYPNESKEYVLFTKKINKDIYDNTMNQWKKS